MWSAAATPLLLLLGLTVVLVASVSNSSSYSFGYSSAIQPVGLQDLMDLRSRENLVGLRSINSSNYADDSYGRNRRRLGKEPNYAKQVYNPRFHKCKDAGEAYSAAYLITKEHVLQQKTNYNLTWVNCEMASFIMMNGKANPDKNVDGTVLQTLDVFELSVVHLSAYERLQRRWWRTAGKVADMEPVAQTAELLKQRALYMKEHRVLENTYNSERYNRLNRTVVIMPFLGSDMGAGHSLLQNRLNYLRACFWSFYHYYPHVVASVKSEKDRNYVREHSGLPFYDVMQLRDLPKSASLPVGTVQETKRRLRSSAVYNYTKEELETYPQIGKWDGLFDYVFFTESDQILLMRNEEEIYEYIDRYPRHLMVPHRLMPYPHAVLTKHHKRELNTNSPFDWMDMSCCMPRTNCPWDRKTWVSVGLAPNSSKIDSDVRKAQKDSKHDYVEILNIYGLQVPLGNTDFHRESYRRCQLNQIGNPPYRKCP